MTALPERIRKDLIQAMKAKERLRVGTLRMMTAALKNKEIEKRAPLSDEEAVQVLKTQLKQRAESIEQFERGGRTDLVEKERQEKIWIESYLPEPLSAEDMEKVVADVIREVGAVGAKDMGVVMRESMRRLQATGKMVDGKAVNSLVRRKLQSLPENASKEPE
ncbi:MAG TPA: GatB/YqeY domain-containing protein [Vicinamibacteria bacterium]|nr:GatB/YqeY domain-containing protein [Vicinamibacteria bacterium]